jgi:hypothetical protein
MRLVLTFAAMALLTGSAAAAPHPCADDAIARGEKLLQFHFSDGEAGLAENVGMGDEVTVLPPIKALKGKGKFDVLEVMGFIYKAEYRIRLIYAQIPDACVLMGQEILEASDPY